LDDRIDEHKKLKQQIFDEKVHKIEEKAKKQEKKAREVLKELRETHEYKSNKFNEKFNMVKDRKK